MPMQVRVPAGASDQAKEKRLRRSRRANGEPVESKMSEAQKKAKDPIERSLELIGADDLERFALIASRDRDDFFTRYPRPQNFLCSALCQSAAMHYIDRVNGVKDIDVWSFFVKTAGVPKFNPRRRVERDLGPSKFGVHPFDANRGFVGRRVDLLGRSIDVARAKVR
jgi:hypothetical protein